MANYFPVQNPTQGSTLTADGSGSGGDPLEFTGNGQGDGHVQRAASGSRYAGIASQDFTPGTKFTVYNGCATFYGVAEGAVAAGDKLAASTIPGHQVKTATPGAEVIGKAIGNAADGTQVHWVQSIVAG